MEGTDVEKTTSPEENSQLNRNRSFKSKQLVRSQAIRETQSPPRTFSPALRVSPSVGNISPSATSPTPSVTSPSVNSPSVTSASGTRTVTSDESSHISVSCSDVVQSSDVKHSNSDEFKKKLPVEIQITSGVWEESSCTQGERRQWSERRDHSLLSNNPRVACVCGACAACPHCRGRRRRPPCPTKQDSGIVCSEDCPDCSDNESGSLNNDGFKKSNSVEVEETYCRCPERKERIKNVSLSRNDSDDRNEISGPELVAFIKETLNKNPRDRIALLKIEKELHALVNDTGRCIVRFPVMTSYGRMLVHRCAALFQLSHHLDLTNRTSVLVSKSGTSGGRLPCTSFRAWCTAAFPPSPKHQTDTAAKYILKRDSNSLDESGGGSLAANRSKSLEQREREYERVRRRIFSSDNNCTQEEETTWPWVSGPVRVLTADGRNKLLKVHSLEGREGRAGQSWRSGAVSKSHSFGGYEPATQHQAHTRLLSRQGDLASSSWRLSPSSSGYKTLSLRSTDSVTPSPTGGASPEPAAGNEPAAVVWAVTDMSAVPPGAVVIHPQTGRALTNPDGSVYHFDPDHPPLFDTGHSHEQKIDRNEKRRGRLEKQHSFMDNDCECQPSDEYKNKCCCECRRHNVPQQRNTTEKEINTKPSTPTRYDTNIQTITQETKYELTNEEAKQFETTNQEAEHFEPTNEGSEQFEPANQIPDYEPANQRVAFVNSNATVYESRSYETANQSQGNELTNSSTLKLANQEHQEIQYQGYSPEEITSPQALGHYIPQETMQVTPQAKVTPVPMPDPNIRPMSLTNMTNMVYPTVPQGYPYACRIDPQLHMYQQMIQPEEQKIAPAHNSDTAFRIDPSYPYAAVDYSCGACVDTNTLPQRSYSVPYGQLEVPYTANMMLPHHHIQPYPYQEQMQWAGVAPTPKIVLPEIYPLVSYPQPAYQHYNIMYPQVIPQAYPVCQPVYPVVERPLEPRRNSIINLRSSKRSSVSNSARNTPLQEEKVPYDDKTRRSDNTRPNSDNSRQVYDKTTDNNRQVYDNRPNSDNIRQYDNNRTTDNNRQVYDNRQVYETRQTYDSERQNSDNNRLNYDSNRQIITLEAQNRDVNCQNQDIPRPEISRQNSETQNSDMSRPNSDIAVRIQQIKNQMAQLNTRDRRKDEWRRRNSGNGLLGNCPINAFNGRPMGRHPNEEVHLNSAARAIVNSIRNLQAKNTYQPDTRREYQRYDKDRPDFRRRDRDERPDRERDQRPDQALRGVNMPVYRQPYLFRQMSPGTWCRRSPGPVHPVLNHPRRPPPDTRHPRR